MLLSFCTPLSHREESVPNRPVTKAFKARPDVLRKAVERALVNKNYGLETERSTFEHVETGWLRDGRYRSIVKGDIRPINRERTELTLTIIVEKKSLGKEVWNPWDEVGIDTYDQLMGDVEMEIYRVLYDGD
ncbi:MAG: hypothetical protein JSU72_01740 [Deltaproteobacteria bacterium]|nr:MAG: hypothetical protein JSU72_01740 [Deltaproteobacteria bacterium]